MRSATVNDSEHGRLEIDTGVYDWSVRLFSLVRRVLGVNVRLHGDDDDIEAGDIFLFNHFARFETFIPQYLIFEHTGAYCRSVASAEFFGEADDGFTAYLRNVGAVPNDLPDLLPFLAAEILRGRKVVIFPEGGIVKDRQVLDQRGRFSIFSRSAEERRKHHSGAAYLALALDAFKESVRLAEHDGHGERLEALARVLRMGNAGALLAAARRPTRIVPANITFYPIRVDDNLLRRGADMFARGLSRRVSEELLIEGNLLLKHTDMDIRLGRPVRASGYWRWWEQKLLRFALRKAGSLEDYYALRGGRGSPAQRLMATVMRRHAERVRDDCMRRMYGAVSVNLSHLAASLMLDLCARGITVMSLASFQRLLYLAVKLTQREPTVHLHRSLRNPQAYDGLIDGVCDGLEQLLATAQSTALVDHGAREGESRTLRLRRKLLDEHEFDSVRLENVIRVYANEVAPVAAVAKAVEQALREAVAPGADHIAGLRFDDERIAWAWDREHYSRPEKSDLAVPETATESGEPFLLLPESRREHGIVLVHGFLASPAEVRAFGERLVGLGHPVIGVRLKGHGTTPWDLRERGWRDWLGSVERGIGILRGYVSRVVLVGFSTGGALALLAAAARPPGLDAVVSVSAPLKFRNRNLAFVPLVHGANRLVRWMSSLEGVYPFRANDSEHPTINYHHIPIRALYELTRMVAELQRTLPEVRCPVLVLQGDADTVVDAKSAAMLIKGLVNARCELQMISTARHGILYENIDGTQERIVAFLDALDREASRRGTG